MTSLKGAELIINDVPFSIFRNGKTPAIAAGTFGPVEQGVDTPTREVPIVMADYSGGMGVCREMANTPNTYAFGLDVCTRYQGVVMPAGLRTPITLTSGWGDVGKLIASLWFKGTLFLITEKRVLSLNTATWAVTSVHTFGGTYRATAAVVYNDALVIGGEVLKTGSSTLYRSGLLYRSTDGTTFTTGTMRGRLLAVVYWVVGGIGKNRLIVTTSGAIADDEDGKAVYRHSYMRTLFDADPTVADNWTAVIPIGNIAYDIKSLAYANKKVWFVKTEGICDVDQRGYSPVLTPQWRKYFNETNGLCSLFHDGFVYGSHARGLDRIDTDSRVRDDDPSWCQPGYGLSNQSPIFGQVQALTTDDGWVVAAVYNGQDSYVLYGKDRRKLGVEGPTEMIWHGAEIRLRGEKITYLEVVSPPNAQPFMLVGARTSTNLTTLYRVSLPKAANGVQELLNAVRNTPATTHQFSTTFKLFLPARTWGDPSARKVLRSFDFMTDFVNNRTDGASVRAFANADGGLLIWGDEPLSRSTVVLPNPAVSPSYYLEFESALEAVNYAAPIPSPDWDEFNNDPTYRATYVAMVQAAVDAAIQDTIASNTAVFPAGGVTVSALVANNTPMLVLDTGAIEVAAGSSKANVLWDYQGKVTTSPREAFLPTTAVETGYQLAICLVGRGSETNPPLVYSTKIRAELLVDQLEIKTYQLVIGEAAVMANSARDTRGTNEVWSRLWTLQNRGPVTIIDEWDEELQAKIEPPITYEEVDGPHGQGTVLVATVKMSLLRRGSYWDVGYNWGEPIIWS